MGRLAPQANAERSPASCERRRPFSREVCGVGVLVGLSSPGTGLSMCRCISLRRDRFQEHHIISEYAPRLHQRGMNAGTCEGFNFHVMWFRCTRIMKIFGCEVPPVAKPSNFSHDILSWSATSTDTSRTRSL